VGRYLRLVMPSLTDITPLAIVAILIILTDRWVVRFYRLLTEQLERQAASDQQLMLIMLQCAESLVTIRDSWFDDAVGDE
jgi:hypothetical protein